MVRWKQKKQDLTNQAENVFFKKKKDGPTVATAHQVFLADQSEVFKTKLHGGFHISIPNGGHVVIILDDWASIIDNDMGLQTFVALLYGSADIAALDIKTLLDVHCLASHYDTSDLRKFLAEKIKGAKIPLADIPTYLTYANDWSDRTQEHIERRKAVLSSIENTLLEKPGNKEKIAKIVNIDLSHLRDLGNLSGILPRGTNLDDLLDAYKKFLALKVICGDTSVPQKFSPSALVDQV